MSLTPTWALSEILKTSNGTLEGKISHVSITVLTKLKIQSSKTKHWFNRKKTLLKNYVIVYLVFSPDSIQQPMWSLWKHKILKDLEEAPCKSHFLNIAGELHTLGDKAWSYSFMPRHHNPISENCLCTFYAGTHSYLLHNTAYINNDFPGAAIRK